MGLLTPLAVRIGAIGWLPRLLPQITWIDTRLQTVTRGRLGLLTIAGLPNLLLMVRGVPAVPNARRRCCASPIMTAG